MLRADDDVLDVRPHYEGFDTDFEVELRGHPRKRGGRTQPRASTCTPALPHSSGIAGDTAAEVDTAPQA